VTRRRTRRDLSATPLPPACTAHRANRAPPTREDTVRPLRHLFVEDRERGDVPGWVLVTLMTAGLVLALWAVAGPALTDVFESAIARVTSFGG